MSIPTRRAAISFAGITSIAIVFVAALTAHLAITTPRAEATPACAPYWILVAFAQADRDAAYQLLSDTQTDWFTCEATTPGDCVTEYVLVLYAQADLDAAELLLSDLTADAVGCEGMNAL